MPVQKRANGYASRVVVPADLRPMVRRGEVVRKLPALSMGEARLRAAQWEGHVAGLFRRLRSDGRMRESPKLVQLYVA